MRFSKKVCRHRTTEGRSQRDLDELLLLAEIVPDQIRKRVLERPDAFRRLPELKDRELDALLSRVGQRMHG